MATYADLKAKIALDLRRSDLAAEIAIAVLDAIRDHGAERFYFNETRSYTLTLSSGTSEYTLAAQAPVAEFVKIDWIRVPISGTNVRLDRVRADEMEELHASTVTGQPDCWTYYSDKVRFFPTPNATFTATIAGHYRLTELSAETDTNAWTNAAKNLIRYSALKRLFAYPIRNVEQAQVATAAETLELEYLRRETDRRKRTGQMTAYY